MFGNKCSLFNGKNESSWHQSRGTRSQGWQTVLCLLTWPELQEQGPWLQTYTWMSVSSSGKCACALNFTSSVVINNLLHMTLVTGLLPDLAYTVTQNKERDEERCQLRLPYTKTGLNSRGRKSVREVVLYHKNKMKYNLKETVNDCHMT